MSEENIKALANEVLTLLNEIEDLCDKIRMQIKKALESKGERVWSWNPEAIKWEKAEGFKGPFEKSEDFNNREFKAMLKDLAAHGGKLTREGYFYWIYKNGSTVGRKKRGERPKTNGSDNT